MSSVKKEVRQFVVDNLLFGETDLQLRDNDSFVELGIVDSAGVLELVTFLEATYQLKIEDKEVIPANLDSINVVCSFVESKRVASIPNGEQVSDAS